MQRNQRMLSANPRQSARKPAPEQKGKTFQGKRLLPESQGQNLALTVLYVPSSGLPDTPQRAHNERARAEHRVLHFREQLPQKAQSTFFQVLDLRWRSTESGDLWYEPRQSKKRIRYPMQRSERMLRVREQKTERCGSAGRSQDRGVPQWSSPSSSCGQQRTKL